MKQSFVCILACILTSSLSLSAQDKFSIDYGLNARIDIGGQNNTNFVLGACLGMGRLITSKEVFPTFGNDRWGIMCSFKVGFNLYRGGIGNSKLPGLFDDHQIDLYNSFSFTPGFFASKKAKENFNYERPLYTWNANYANTLINPWQYSLTAATNFIWNLPINGRDAVASNGRELFPSVSSPKETPIIRERRSQRIGFLGLAIGKYVSLGYYNDGPPFGKWLGDGYDRYWTGGGFIHFCSQEKRPGGDSTGYRNNTQIIWSFDKFTGYQQDAYEVANRLKFRRVPYLKYETGSFNRGIMHLNLIRNEISMGVSFYDSPNWDIQDFIHRMSNYPYHPNIYTPGFTIGGQYQLRSTLLHH